MSWGERGRDLAARLRANLPLEIIVDRPINIHGPVGIARSLKALDFAPGKKDDFDSKRALEAEEYAAVVAKLEGASDPDSLNNLGCAYAWLAQQTGHNPYWGLAIKAFQRSLTAAESEDEALRQQRENRARANRTVVEAASGLEP